MMHSQFRVRSLAPMDNAITDGQEMPHPLGKKEFSGRPSIRVAVRMVLQH